jgi:hypothetical protein
MNHASHNKLISFIWSIADDCLSVIFVTGIGAGWVMSIVGQESFAA